MAFSYNTQGFAIKFGEEEYHLNEVINFTQEVKLPSHSQINDISEFRVPLMMEMRLFARPEIDEKKLTDEEIDNLNPQYKQTRVQEIRVGNITSGIYKFIPVQFDAPFVGSISTSVHCGMTQLHLIDPSKNLMDTYKSSKSKKAMDESEEWDQLQTIESSSSLSSRSISSLDIEESTTMAKYLFKMDERFLNKVTKKQANQSIEHIGGVLVNQYNKLRTSYYEILTELKNYDKGYIKPKLQVKPAKKSLPSFYCDDSDSDNCVTVQSEFGYNQSKTNDVSHDGIRVPTK